MEILFLLWAGIIVGSVFIFSTQKNNVRKRKYGYSKSGSFDYCSTINNDILLCNQDDQHANKE